ncbi:MAG: hypothetical protein ABIJ81_02850 [Patescibacteria group bacterium]
MDNNLSNLRAMPPQQQTNTNAILGLIFAFIFFSVGLILSIIALKQINVTLIKKVTG